MKLETTLAGFTLGRSGAINQSHPFLPIDPLFQKRQVLRQWGSVVVPSRQSAGDSAFPRETFSFLSPRTAFSLISTNAVSLSQEGGAGYHFCRESVKP